MEENIFLEKLSELLREFGLKNCVLAGEDCEGKMKGFFCIEKYNIGYTKNEEMASYLNAARMYQSAREKTMVMFDRF